MLHFSGNVASEVRLLCDLEQPEPTWYTKMIICYVLFDLVIYFFVDVSVYVSVFCAHEINYSKPLYSYCWDQINFITLRKL